MAWILDLDGVLWLGQQPIAGSDQAVSRLLGAGERVVFVTNNSLFTVGEQRAHLARSGVPAGGELLTSAMAAASLLDHGETALVCAGRGVTEALAARGVRTVEEGDADAVVVGFHTDFSYDRLRAAHGALHRGARLLATNDDPTYPTADGPIPGGGAILAAVAAAAGMEPLVAGKPNRPMADLCRRLAGSGPHIVVGDRASTDGAFARALGARFALVLSGVTDAAGGRPGPDPDLVAPDLAAVVAGELT